MVIGADYNFGSDNLGIIGEVDDVFVLNRAASAAEVQAFYERRFPITLPTATVTTP
jgi:hypothetical protein